MKKIITMMLLGTVLTAFILKEEIGGSIENVTALKGYRLKNNTINLHDFNFWVITNETSFNEEFIADSDAVTRPRFSEQWVVAAKVETYNYSYKVSFNKIELNNNNLDVYFSVKKAGPAQNGKGQVEVAAFAKNKLVKKVNFYHNNVLVKSVPVVNVF